MHAGRTAAQLFLRWAVEEDAYVAQRHKDEADTLTKMMKVIHPNPVKMFACGAEVALMLLETMAHTGVTPTESYCHP